MGLCEGATIRGDFRIMECSRVRMLRAERVQPTSTRPLAEQQPAP